MAFPTAVTGHKLFADAKDLSDSTRFVIFGVPYDRTASFRPGARFAPDRIREASYNFETYITDLGVDLRDVPFADIGDVEEVGAPKEMVRAVYEVAREVVSAPVFTSASTGSILPFVVGGEHSVSPSVVRALFEKYGTEMGVLVVDAHLDFRDEYLGEKHSHACAVRRISETVSVEKVWVVGVRSASREEHSDAVEMGLRWFSPEEAEKLGARGIVERFFSTVGVQRVYLSVDIDGIDPSEAPGTGTPEPFGLRAVFVRDMIRAIGGRLVGMDVVEVCPPVDNGNTAALAARLLREAMAVVCSADRRHEVEGRK